MNNNKLSTSATDDVILTSTVMRKLEDINEKITKISYKLSGKVLS